MNLMQILLFPLELMLAGIWLIVSTLTIMYGVLMISTESQEEKCRMTGFHYDMSRKLEVLLGFIMTYFGILGLVSFIELMLL